MITLKTMAAIFAIVVGIPSQIIDYKHRKRKAYEPENAWGYYAALSGGGSWEGRFMMWSGYLGIVFVVAALGYLFYAVSK